MKPKDTLPFQAIPIDATPEIFLSSLKVCRNTKPIEASSLERQLEEIFVPKTYGQ
jgi:hypothetical protein